MSADQDFSSLPVEEKIAHNIWKVRLDGYTALVAQFEASRNEQDPCFDLFANRPESLKGLVTDSNVVAQESGIQALCKYLEFGGSAQVVSKLKTSSLVPALCEKGLSSSRAGTKAKATESLLLLIEISGSADWVLEQMVPYFENRLPKLVAGCVAAVSSIYDNFGTTVASPKIVIPKLVKLFAHADKNVRAETTKLTVVLYQWLGDGLTQLLFSSLKPVQQRDLTAEFEKIKGQAPEQKRLTRAQQQEIASRQQTSDVGESNDVHMEDVSAAAPAQFDPYAMLEPVEVLSKLPSDLSSRMASTKWKDRKEALDEVYLVLSKAPKLADDNYIDLVRIFAKCMKDANIQVVQLAANGVEFLSKGLKENFHKYQNLVVGPMIERSKEKKPSVAESLANALDSIFQNSSLSDVLDETLAGMSHKTPQVKIAATNYLQRCLTKTSTVPKSSQIDAIMEVGVKLLGDSQEPIRQAATEMIGTLMKITGERELKTFLEKVDENRLSKVKAVFESVTVSASKSANPASSASAPRAAASSLRMGAAPSLKKNTASQAIPSKRLATSPAKRTDAASKLPVKSFTGRSLISPSTNGISRAAPTQQEAVSSVPRAVHEEALQALQQENRQLRSEIELHAKAQSNLSEEIQNAKQENVFLKDKIETLAKDSSNGSLMVKQKDTQILRLTSDLENAKLKIKSLEQTIEMMKLKQSTSQTQTLLPYSLDADRSPFRSPEKFGSPKLSQQELSTRVNRLSIEGAHGESNGEPSNHEVRSERTSMYSGPEKTGVVTEEENWRKAAEVTAQLKARIEKMKQRNRLSSR